MRYTSTLSPAEDRLWERRLRTVFIVWPPACSECGKPIRERGHLCRRCWTRRRQDGGEVRVEVVARELVAPPPLWRLNACNRCGGSVYYDEDRATEPFGGWTCIACGGWTP